MPSRASAACKPDSGAFNKASACTRAAFHRPCIAAHQCAAVNFIANKGGSTRQQPLFARGAALGQCQSADTREAIYRYHQQLQHHAAIRGNCTCHHSRSCCSSTNMKQRLRPWGMACDEGFGNVVVRRVPAAVQQLSTALGGHAPQGNNQGQGFRESNNN